MKRIVILGSGESGTGASMLAKKQGFDVFVSDKGLIPDNFKQELNAIVDRRNKIAHEADIDPTFNVDDRWPINEHLVNNAVTFIERVVEAIHNIL